jgi:hypothetical protein
MAMRTYLTVSYNSEGANPSHVRDRLMAIGFKAIQGNFDYEYEWDKTPSVDEIVWFGDKIRATLEGCKVQFKMETI